MAAHMLKAYRHSLLEKDPAMNTFTRTFRKTPKAAVAGLALGVVSLPVVAGLTMSPAQAAEIEENISKVVVSGFQEGTPVAVGDEINISADWSVPDNSVKSGDVFTMDLPIQLEGDSSFQMKNANGDVVANATVQGQRVTVTFTDFVNTHPLNVRGTLYFKARVANVGNDGEPFTITWNGVSSQPITPYVPAPGVHDQESFKRGFIDSRGVNQWAIEVPGTYGSPVFTDTPGDNSLNCSSIRVGYYNIIDKGDGVRGYDEPHELTPDQYNLTCSPSTFTVQYPALQKGQVMAALIDVDMDAPRDTDKNGSLENSFTATVNGQTQSGTVQYANAGAGGTGDGENNPIPTPNPTETTPNPDPTETTPTIPNPEPTETTPNPEPTETTPNPEPTETTPNPEPRPSETGIPNPDPTETQKPEPSPSATETKKPEPSSSATETKKPEPSPSATETKKPEPNPSATETKKPEPGVGGGVTPGTPGTPGAPDQGSVPGKHVSGGGSDGAGVEGVTAGTGNGVTEETSDTGSTATALVVGSIVALLVLGGVAVAVSNRKE